MLWTILTGLLVALTKYLTSLRLRNLRDKIQKDQKDASSLKQQLFDVSEKEELLKVGLRGFMWVDIGISG